MFQPSQLGTFPCEDGCGFLVLLDFAAVGYTEDGILLVHGDNRNLLEEFHTIECCDLWDEREYCRPLVLVTTLVSWDIRGAPAKDTHSVVCISSLIQNGSGSAAVSDIQPGQFRDALEEFAKVFHLVPTRQLHSGYLAASAGEVCEEGSVPLGSAQSDALEGFQWSWCLRLAG